MGVIQWGKYMSAKIDRSKRTRRKRISGKSIKEAAQQIAHDISGPLNFVAEYVKELSAPMALGACSEVEIHAAAIRSLERVIRCVNGLKDLPLEGELLLGCHDFAEVIRTSIVEFAPLAEKKGVSVKYEGIDHLIGWFDRDKVLRVLENLISNAIKATSRGQQVCVSLMHAGKSVWIEVCDNGVGVPAGADDKIFRRGFSSGKVGGLGLGLYYSKDVMEMHGGSINYYEAQSSGASFTLSFPMSAIVAAALDEVDETMSLNAVILDADADAYDLGGCIAPICEGCSSVYLSRSAESRGIPSDAEITLDP